MKSFYELVKKRQSVRKYDSRLIDRKIIERCIESARLAPSACNSQPWHFIVIDEPKLKSKLAQMIKTSVLRMNLFVDKSPVLVALINRYTLQLAVG
ncbi:MAG: nitroreductase family protein [Nanoarchaeota archaeon]